jgi:hypothetical protein
MDFLELLFGLIEALDLVEYLCKVVAWLFRSMFRLCRWMMGFPETSEGWVYRAGERRRAAAERHVLHLSLTRRRRGKWQRGSYVLR